MIEWKEEMVIAADIEKVWRLFADENIKQIMPKVESHRLIEKQATEAGAKHEQTYREGKRLETYIVETVAYEDTPMNKHKQVSFLLGKAFQVTYSFTLEKMGNGQTKFVYAGSNQGANFVGRAMLKMATEKSNMNVVRDFMERVETEALKS
ncbi:SRPBCC family protein [Planococcus sp. YIM B11945]|uniref:SRPBCC family protein n=1 Tax=Planococcus sp. YIM B11945 TaxID=3435410 RepID=UPI003D7D5025